MGMLSAYHIPLEAPDALPDFETPFGHSAAPMGCRILSTEQEITAVAAEWRTLQARVGWSPFTDYDLFRAWWDHVGKAHGYQPHVIVGRAEGRLVALLPLVVKRRRGLRVLEWAGGGWFDFCDLLAETQHTGNALWQKARESKLYDIAVIRDVHPKALSRAPLQSFATLKETRDSYSIKLDWKSGDAWLASLSRKMRGKLPRKTNQLKQVGPTEFHMYESGALPTHVVETLLRQKIEWSESFEKKKIFDHDAALAMFHAFARAAAAKGELYLCWMTCGETIIGSRLGFKRNGVLYSYQASYDLAWSSYSPGTLVLMNLIGWAVDKGIQRMDFMRGAYNYKDKYANEIKPLSDFIFSRTLQGRLAQTLALALPPLRARWAKIKNSRKVTAPAVEDEKAD